MFSARGTEIVLILQRLGQTLKDAMVASEVPIIVELDWTESITHPDERWGAPVISRHFHQSHSENQKFCRCSPVQLSGTYGSKCMRKEVPT